MGRCFALLLAVFAAGLPVLDLAATTSAGHPLVPTSGLILNVKAPAFGAMGNGLADDTSALQKAVQAVAGTGGTVVVPAGTYLVNPTAHHHAGIRLGSNMTLRFEPGAVLKAASTSTSNYILLLASGVRNVTIRGGTLVGNRHDNTISDLQEAGMGVMVMNSQHVVVEGLTARDFWADGFYVGQNAKDVTLLRVTADGNRRQGLSITSVQGLVVQDSTFRNTTGLWEQGQFVCGYGTGIEPNDGQTVDDVRFTGCTFALNAAGGLAVGPAIAHRGRAFVSRVVIDGNSAFGNGWQAGGAGITISNTTGHQILNNLVEGNLGDGIYLRNEANDILVKGNTVTGTQAAPHPGDIGYGILLYKTAGNLVTENTVRDSAACGIRNAAPWGPNRIGRNRLQGNHPNLCP